MTNYLEKRCEKRAAAMSEAAVRDHLAQSSGWRHAGNAIEKRFAFKGWLETVAFVDALAWVCHVEDHHPTCRSATTIAWSASRRIRPAASR